MIAGAGVFNGAGDGRGAPRCPGAVGSQRKGGAAGGGPAKHVNYLIKVYRGVCGCRTSWCTPPLPVFVHRFFSGRTPWRWPFGFRDVGVRCP